MTPIALNADLSAGPTLSVVVEQDDLIIPVVDFSVFLNGDNDAKQKTAEAMLNAFQSSGFLYLSNHGIPLSTVDQVFSESARFFARPDKEKNELGWYGPEANRGYVTIGREKVTQLGDADEIENLRNLSPDYKETMEIGRDGVKGKPNMWPDKIDEEGKMFTKVMKSFHLTCKELHVQVMRALALGLSYSEDYFDSYTDAGDNTLRLLHYPQIPMSIFRDNPDAVRAGAHSDYGSITLLFQDEVGGLEVKSPKNTWVRAKPIKGTIVVNAGDLLARWSNDTIKSTNHRVVQPPMKKDGDNGMYPDRYSVAYFCNPNFDRYIETLPGTYKDPSDRKYEGIYSGEYLAMRLGLTFAAE